MIDAYLLKQRCFLGLGYLKTRSSKLFIDRIQRNLSFRAFARQSILLRNYFCLKLGTALLQLKDGVGLEFLKSLLL